MQTSLILDPTVVEQGPFADPSPRLGALRGMRLGFVDNSKLNADAFIDELAAQLERQYAVDTGVRIRKLAPKDRLSNADIERLGACDAVVLCFGDCGTSTSMNVADGVMLERAGIPTATVISEAFSDAAHVQAAGRGMPQLQIVAIPHPMHTATAEQVTSRADASVKDVERVLTELIVASAPPVPVNGAVVGEPATVEDPELYFAEGWTDGLPVVPPTAAKVAAMLATVARDPEELIGPIPPRMRMGSIRKIATNAVLAGCLPAYFPTVLTALEALLENDVQLYGIQTATNTTTPLLILNGPIISELDVNVGSNALGNGCRASATIGRAVQLILRNIGGDIAGETDMSTHGWPGKFTFCIGENEAASPWRPFHVGAGFRADESTVTVIGGSSTQNIFTYGCETGAEILDHLIGALSALGHNNIIFPTGPMLALSPEHAQTLARDGYSKADVSRAIFERARVPLSRFGARTVTGLHHRRARWFAEAGDPDHIGVADKASDVHIIVTGGAGIHSQFIPTAFSFRPVTHRIPANASRS